MSTYYFNVSMISRGKGQSAIASASYRSGESLYSKLDMETKNYGKRTVAPETFILAPEHAPDWVYDRETLWNEVELFENRINSVLAREVTLALPIELDHEQQRKLLEEYVNENFVIRGMVADVAIHRDVEHNPHAHIMLTVRPFNKDGSWGNKKAREYIKDSDGNFILDSKGKKKFRTIDLTDWNKRETLLEWRKNLAEKINDYYKKNNINERVSHESYEKQGLDIIAKHRLARAEYQVDKKKREEAKRKGIEYKPQTHVAKLNHEIDIVNKEIRKLNSKIVDLNEYRKRLARETLEKLNSIRRNAMLTESQWNSLKVVAKRTNGYVDFDKAYDNLKRLKYWKMKLDRDKTKVIAVGKTLQKARVAFKNNPKDVMIYGFVPHKFEKEYDLKMSQYVKDIDKYNKELNSYNEIKLHSERAYEVQKTFVEGEFNLLYPQYKNVLGNNEKSASFMALHVNMFRNEHKVLNRIDLFHSGDLYKYSDEYVKAEELINSWNEVNNSLLVLDRTLKKHQREFAQQFNEWDENTVYEKSVSFANVQEQIKLKEELKQSLHEGIQVHLELLYPDVDKETISMLPPESKARLLAKYVDGQTTGTFSKDVLAIEQKIKEELHERLQEGGSYEHNRENASTEVADLFGAIIYNAQARESSKEFERRRKEQKKKNRVKGHRLYLDSNEL